MRSRVEFNTDEYERSHGKSPRGFGSWAFVDYVYARSADYLARVFWVNGANYAGAKRVARAHFSQLDGFSGEAVVLP